VIRQHALTVATRGRGTYDVTDEIQSFVGSSGLSNGLCHVFIAHTSASLMVCENADPAVMRDLEAFFSREVPDGDPLFTHTAEGPDDMPAHVRSVLTQTGISLPFSDGRCTLGTWQGVYVYEHRHAPYNRSITVTLQGEPAG